MSLIFVLSLYATFYLLANFAVACRLCSNTVLSSLHSFHRPHPTVIQDYLSVSMNDLHFSRFFESSQVMHNLSVSIQSDLKPFGCLLSSDLMGYCGDVDSFSYLSRLPLLLHTSSNDQDSNSSSSNVIKSAMKASIMWYKNYLSPVMPPRCRFLPSCSSYGLEAIEKFGPWKGGILIAWRIFRCNPFGGTGYDPPVWPPPNYFAGSTTGKWK